jgi:hypothetical protein
MRRQVVQRQDKSGEDIDEGGVILGELYLPMSPLPMQAAERSTCGAFLNGHAGVVLQ